MIASFILNFISNFEYCADKPSLILSFFRERVAKNLAMRIPAHMEMSEKIKGKHLPIKLREGLNSGIKMSGEIAASKNKL